MNFTRQFSDIRPWQPLCQAGPRAERGGDSETGEAQGFQVRSHHECVGISQTHGHLAHTTASGKIIQGSRHRRAFRLRPSQSDCFINRAAWNIQSRFYMETILYF